MSHDGKYLQNLSPLPQMQAKMPCVVLAHNELLILPEFLRHYREIGVDRFFVVDDRSTDGSVEFLRKQQDVTIFTPVKGSSYRKDKRFWRAELLDTYCDGKWVVVPDVDEHLVYKGIDAGRDLFALVSSLENEGALAIHATMLDMYCDKPLQDHRFEGGRLIDTFPLFDGPDYYLRIAAPPRFRKKYPTPFAFAVGGVRQRLFEPIALGVISSRLLSWFCDISGHFMPVGFEKIGSRMVRMVIHPLLKSVDIYNCSKIPFLKWKKGLFFYGGAHALSRILPLSGHNCILLHFKFVAGLDGLNYIAARGQHADDSKFYKNIVNQKKVLSEAPTFQGTHSYENSTSLGRFLS